VPAAESAAAVDAAAAALLASLVPARRAARFTVIDGLATD
jgi:ABC-type lipoprotein release transport system permease subunit